MLAHAGHNAFIQGAFEPLTTRPDGGQWITGEWGAALPIAIAVVLAFSWWLGARRRRGAQPIAGSDGSRARST